MSAKFNEDSRVKIPSILHLCSMGYDYLSLKDHQWDASNNIFTDIFNESVNYLNGGLDAAEITPKDLSRNKGNKFISKGEYDVTEAGIKSASLKLLPGGTVLMSSRAPIGYLAIATRPVTTNQGFKSFVPNKGYSTHYIYYTIKHLMKLIEANSSGSTFKEVSSGVLKAIKTQLPPADVHADFNSTVSKIAEQQSNLEKQNQHLTTLRDWLLPMLMNGQVTVK